MAFRRAPRRTETPLASSFSATRDPVLPVAPMTRIGSLDIVFSYGEPWAHPVCVVQEVVLWWLRPLQKQGRRPSHRDQTEQRCEIDEVELDLHAPTRIPATGRLEGL